MSFDTKSPKNHLTYFWPVYLCRTIYRKRRFVYDVKKSWGIVDNLQVTILLVSPDNFDISVCV